MATCALITGGPHHSGGLEVSEFDYDDLCQYPEPGIPSLADEGADTPIDEYLQGITNVGDLSTCCGLWTYTKAI